MNTARDDILVAISQHMQGGAPSPEARATVDARLANPLRHVIPAYAQLPHAALVRLFVEKAQYAAATCGHVVDAHDVPAAIADFLVRESLPTTVVMAPDPKLAALPWHTTTLSSTQRTACDSDKVGITGAFAGIAETGTLMLLSGAHSPTTLNFLPETHIVVLDAQHIVGVYEEGWALFRAQHTAMPRTVNHITGPSRSGDIEQTMQLGAHGPLRLHIVIVGD